MTTTVKYILTLIILSAVVTTVCAQDKFKVIVNEANTVESLSKKEISDLFLKKKMLWADDKKVLPIDQEKKSEIREIFSKDIHGKNANVINSYWQKQIFSGRNVPPPEKQSDKEIIEYVKNNAGAIGYVSAASKTDGVRELKIK